jgi:hypothetical protein
MSAGPTAAVPRRSALLTVTGWLVIVHQIMTVPAAFGGIFAWAVISVVTPGVAQDQGGAFFQQLRESPTFSMGPIISTGMVLLAPPTIAAAIGLLRRGEWGRRLLVVMLVAQAVWTVLFAVVLAATSLTFTLDTLPVDMPPSVELAFGVLRVVPAVVNGLWLCAVTNVMIWAALKLRSASVRQEFARGSAGGQSAPLDTASSRDYGM